MKLVRVQEVFRKAMRISDNEKEAKANPFRLKPKVFIRSASAPLFSARNYADYEKIKFVCVKWPILFGQEF